MFRDSRVHKRASPEELIATLDALSRQGGQNAVISMHRGMLERLGDEPAGVLSEGEIEVLVLVARGLSNHDVAEHLHPSTIKRNLDNVYEKIGVGSRSEAVSKANPRRKL